MDTYRHRQARKLGIEIWVIYRIDSNGRVSRVAEFMSEWMAAQRAAEFERKQPNTAIGR